MNDSIKNLRGYRLIPLTALALILVAGGCATTSTSTGLMTTPRQQQPLPAGIPARVGVIPFRGDPAISLQATDQFMSGLPALGFQVVERSQIEAVLGELGFQYTDSVDPATSERLAKLLGLEGIFLASITGESSAMWGDSHMNVRLVSVETGNVLWAAEAHDPRTMSWSMDVRTSAVHTVRKALKLLRKDLGRR